MRSVYHPLVILVSYTIGHRCGNRYGTVVVTGGNTLLPGFVERLSGDTVNFLNSQQPNLGSKLGFLAPRTSAERLFAAWIGGKKANMSNAHLHSASCFAFIAP